MQRAAKEKRFANLVVDAHVHLYPCMPVRAMLDAASRNLLGPDGATAAHTGMLLVADPEGVAGYDRLLGESDGRSGGRWRREHGDDRTVTFRGEDGARVIAIRGQQLITREGLEVLGIACAATLASGFPLRETVARIRAARGWAILAWGAGKWLGQRGRTLTRLIEEEAGRRDVMLADNGGRPRAWSHVPQFGIAAKQGMRVLAGTDPLPLRGEERRVGSYAFRIRAQSGDGTAPAEALRCALETDAPIEIVGRPMAIRGFVANQLKLRLKRRAGGRRQP